MGFASPVGVQILENKAPWPGPPTFRVTSTFAQHVASGRGPGIDIGNQRCGAPVLAMEAGIVSFAGQLPTAIGMANVVRYALSPTEELGAAHLATITVRLGQPVIKGQQIGTLGMTGADACHLHQGYKMLVAGQWVERDWWPLYTQGADMTTIVDATTFLGPDGKPAPRSISFAAGTHVGWKLDGTTKSITLAAASSAHADVRAKIIQSPSRAPQGYPFLRILDGSLTGLYVVEAAGKITAGPDPVLDTTAAYNAGVAAAAAKATEAKK